MADVGDHGVEARGKRCREAFYDFVAERHLKPLLREFLGKREIL